MNSQVAPSCRHPLATALIGVMPQSRWKTVLMNKVLRWEVHPTARVGPCLFLRVAHVRLGSDVRLLGLSAFFDLRELSMGDAAIVGRWNWISAASSLRTPALDARAEGRPATVRLGRGGAITSRHYIDCSGGVDIGDFTVLAGVRSTILTHQVDTATAEQDVRSVTVGNYCLLGSNAKVVPGARVPDRCVIAMGAVVVGALPEAGFLYAGVPARPVKPSGEGSYFTRTAPDAVIP